MTARLERGRSTGTRGGAIRPSVVVGAIAFAASLACAAGGTLLYVGIWAEGQAPLDASTVLIPPLGTIAFGSIGALLMVRRPDLATGWLMIGIALLAASTWASGAYLDWGAARQSDLALGSLAAWIDGLWSLGMALLIPRLMLELPSGRLATRRWRSADLLMGAALIFVVVIQLTPGPLLDWDAYDNPFGVEALRDPGYALRGADTAFFLLIITILLIGCASLMVRYRRARGTEREQLKWIAWSVLMIATVYVALPVLAVAAPSLEALAGFLAYAAVLTLPIAIGIAVLRYRLYEIDRLISRTISWAIVTGMLVATFVLVELALQAALVNVNGGSTLAVAASTLAVAAIFGPVRRRVQRGIDGRFDRRHADAESVLATFRDRLRSEFDLDVLRIDALGTAALAVQPSLAGLWLRGDGSPLDVRTTRNGRDHPTGDRSREVRGPEPGRRSRGVASGA